MRFSVLSIVKGLSQIVEKNIFCSYSSPDTTQYLDYRKLNKYQREEINKMAVNKFKKYSLRRWYDIFNCHEKRFKFEHQDIKTPVGFLADYIGERCFNCINIFKTDEECDGFHRKLDTFSSGGYFMSCLYTPKENATILKAYLKQSLNGILAFELADIICRVFKNETEENFKDLIAWLPFILDFNELTFFNKLIKMFHKIDENFSETQMNFNAMIDVFVPLIFPKEIYKKFPELDFKKLAESIFFLDFNKVPIKIVK